MCILVCHCVTVCVFMYAFVCTFVSTQSCVLMCLSLCVCKYMCFCVHVLGCSCIPVYVCVCVYMKVCIMGVFMFRGENCGALLMHPGQHNFYITVLTMSVAICVSFFLFLSSPSSVFYFPSLREDTTLMLPDRCQNSASEYVICSLRGP